MYRRTDGRIRTRKGVSAFGQTDSDTEGYARIRTDGFGHGRVCPDSDGRIRTQKGMSGFGRTDSDTEGYDRIRTDGFGHRRV